MTVWGVTRGMWRVNFIEDLSREIAESDEISIKSIAEDQQCI